MLHQEVEEVITKYAPDVLPVFADRFNRWPLGQNALKVSAALFGAAQRYRDFKCEKEAKLCFQAGVEIQGRVEG